MLVPDAVRLVPGGLEARVGNSKQGSQRQAEVWYVDDVLFHKVPLVRQVCP